MSTLFESKLEISLDLDQLRARIADLEGEVLRLTAAPGTGEVGRSLDSATTDAFIGYDTSFRFTHLNSDAERLLRLSKEEVLGKTQWSIFPETLGSEIEHQYRRAMNERAAVTFDAFYASLDAWLELRISPSAAGGILVWLTDISARRNAELQRERQLRETQLERQILNEIIDKSPVAMSIVRAPELVYELINPAFQAFAPNKEMIGRRFSEVWNASSVSSEAVFARVIETGRPVEIIDEAWTIHCGSQNPNKTIYVSSSWIPLFGANGAPDRILTLSIDTTERKRQEDQLREKEVRLSRAQRMANLGHLEYDIDSGELHLSEDACRIFGVSPCQAPVTLDALLALVHKDDHDVVQETIQKTCLRGECSQLDYRIVLTDGTERFLRQCSEPFREDHVQTLLLGTVQDITEHKHLEEKFRRAQRLEGIARLAGGVAHDFNNLLVIINGYAEKIVDQLSTEDALLDHAQEILNAGNRAAALTRQLLAFSRRQAMRPAVINLDGLLGRL